MEQLKAKSSISVKGSAAIAAQIVKTGNMFTMPGSMMQVSGIYDPLYVVHTDPKNTIYDRKALIFKMCEIARPSDRPFTGLPYTRKAYDEAVNCIADGVDYILACTNGELETVLDILKDGTYTIVTIAH